MWWCLSEVMFEAWSLKVGVERRTVVVSACEVDGVGSSGLRFVSSAGGRTGRQQKPPLRQGAHELIRSGGGRRRFFCAWARTKVHRVSLIKNRVIVGLCGCK